MPDVLLCQGDALQLPLKDASVHTVCTSPPYWQLRRYGCGPGELGLEPTIEAYVTAMEQVFREVKRVLHPMGTCWVNIGDSMRDKQLQGIPWRLALAMQQDGWVLRSEVIWHKLNVMPESVQDRPTRSHEQVFLFAKQGKYYYDAEGVKEATDMASLLRRNPHGRAQNATAKNTIPGQGIKSNTSFHAAVAACLPFRNLRSVWSFASEPFSGSHFATFPTALVRRCLLAGAPSAVCSQCGAPHRRIVERQRLLDGQVVPLKAFCAPTEPFRMPANGTGHARYTTQTTDHGFTPTCGCAAGTERAVILDPFCGSGTTLLVARELGHHAVGLDLSAEYLRNIARPSLGLTALYEWQHGAAPQPVAYDDLPLFAAATPDADHA